MNKNKFVAVLLGATLLLSGCGVGSTIVTVGSQKVTKSEFDFYLASVKKQMAGTELSSDQDWHTKEIEGKTAIEFAKEKTLETAVTNVAYIEVGNKLGLSLSDSEKKTVDNYKQTMVKNYGGQDKYNEFLKQNKLSDKFITMLCESMEYSDKLIGKIKKDSPPTDEEINNYFTQNYLRAKHVLIPTMDTATYSPYPEDKKAQAKTQADEIYKRALAGEDFDILVNQYSQDPGSKTNPDGYVFTHGEMVEEFTNGVQAVPNGGITMVESMYGYHIIKRYALNETPQLYSKFLGLKKADVEKNILADKLSKQMDIWKTEFNIKIEKNEKIYNLIQ